MPNRLYESSKEKCVTNYLFKKKINLYLLIVKPINYIYIFFNLINIDLFLIFNFQHNFITGYIKL